jgi:hypothetical protein
MSQPGSFEETAARMRVLMTNRAAFPPEELLKYVGEWIAWSPDGTAIVAHSAESDMAVYAQLKEKGYEMGQCCISYVDDPNEILLGAVSMIVFPKNSSGNGEPTNS